MPSSSPAAVRHIRRAATLGHDGLTDAQLLDAFVARRDEAAFEALVRRHGPMVLGVCRRVVGQSADADDAFQATFLVLVRRAGALERRELLANWLYGVALRTALEARSRMLRRRAKERPVADLPHPTVEPDAARPELLALLDRELSRLPDVYRVPVVLCELDGTPRKEAARLLGIPEGTLSSRLAAARRMLADRLTRRGVSVGAAAVAAILSQSEALAPVPSSLIGSTVRVAADLAAGAVVPGPVAALTHGVIKTMFLAKLRLTAVLVAVVGFGAAAVTGGLVVADRPALAAPGDDTPKAPPQPDVKGGKKSDADALQGPWKVTSTKPDKALSRESGEPMRFFFVKDKAYLADGTTVQAELGLTLDAKASPKQITLAMPGNKESMSGIYILDGDTLKLAFPKNADGARPRDMESADVVFTLQRDPTAKMGEPAGGANKIKAAAARMRSSNNLKQIMLAMHNFHDATGAFPAAAIGDKDGKPLLSWRVAILPYIEQDALYRQFKLDEPWDSDHNKKLIAQMPKIYGEKGTKTHYRIFTGKNTPFDGPKGVKLSDMTDGTSNTGVVFEAVDAVEWTKPEEFEYDAKKPLPKLGGTPHENGFNVGMGDGSVRFVASKVDEKILRATITHNGGEVIEEP